MIKNHRANATTPTTARADASPLAAEEITLDVASGWQAQRALLVLWPSQAFYLGMGYPTTLHRHHAAQISISLGAPLRVRTRASGPYSEQQSFIVGPNIPHQADIKYN